MLDGIHWHHKLPTIRGVQYVDCVMHKCIMVKLWGNETHKKYVNARKFYKIRGKFAKVGGNNNFSEIGGNVLKQRK